MTQQKNMLQVAIKEYMIQFLEHMAAFVKYLVPSV